MKKEYLTIDEVMSLLDLRRRDVERMVRQGLMPHTQLTKHIVRFNTLDLTEWLKQRSISSTDAMTSKEMMKTADVLEFQYARRASEYSNIPF